VKVGDLQISFPIQKLLTGSVRMGESSTLTDVSVIVSTSRCSSLHSSEGVVATLADFSLTVLRKNSGGRFIISPLAF